MDITAAPVEDAAREVPAVSEEVRAEVAPVVSADPDPRWAVASVVGDTGLHLRGAEAAAAVCCR